MSLEGQTTSGVRREREGSAEEGQGSGRAAKRQAAGGVLAGLRLEGPAWRLRAGAGQGGDGRRLKGLEGMLEQALTCSELADVRFVFDDGVSELGGHRAFLSSVSEVFAGMFRSEMEERKTGRVRVAGVSWESFRAFLEFVYLGRGGGSIWMADGRELWVLGGAFQVDGLQEWLMGEGLWSMDSACAAMQYAQTAEGTFEGLVEACEGRARWELSGATESGLEGLGADAASALLASRRGSKRLWRGCDVLEGFRWAERWVRVNGGVEGVGAAGVERVVDSLDLGRLPLDVLLHVVKPSGLVSDEKLFFLAAAINQQLRKDVLPGELTFAAVGSFGGDQGGQEAFTSVRSVAVDEGGAGLLLAASDESGGCVRVFNGEGGEHVLTIGPDVEGHGRLQSPKGVAFNGRGELLVSDKQEHRILTFGRDGAYLRSIGREGSGEGELQRPGQLAVSPQGHIIVGDTGNHRVQILKEDGAFVRSFGFEGSGPGCFDLPSGVAVGADGSIVVVDHGNARVQVFDSEGAFVRTFGSRGRGPGQFEKPFGVGILPGGQILVSDWGRIDVQVFSWEGVYLRSISKEGDSKVELGGAQGLAVDSQGRVFVACNKPERILMLNRGGA